MMCRKRNALVLFMLVIFIELSGETRVRGNVVFNVMHSYGRRRMAGLSTLKAHDIRRHGRYLTSLNFPVGGDGKMVGSGIYYTKLAIGTPPKDYRLQIDTGSDLMWVNCAGCNTCSATKSRLGFDLTLYDMKASSTAKQVTCEEDICEAMNDHNWDSRCATGHPCEFGTSYYDGSQSRGNIVRDKIKFDESSEDGKTKTTDADIAFGCTTFKVATNTSTDSVDGLIGFGSSKYSVITQLETTNKSRNVFSHCFDGKNGGGVFAIGQVIEPEVKTMIPYQRNAVHYKIEMNSIDVGGKAIKLNKTRYGFTPGMDTLIDSGATLAYLPEEVYEELIRLTMEDKTNLKQYLHENQFKCFEYEGDENKDFPVVTFQSSDSVSLKVYPQDYLVEVAPDNWCFGWQKSNLQENGNEQILLGDLALSNKLVVYDNEKQAIGWTDYDCTSSVKVKDDGSGNAVAMDANNISPDSFSRRNGVNVFTFPLIMAVLYYLII